MAVDEQIGFDYEFVVDRDYAGRLARTVFLHLPGRRLILLALLGLIVLSPIAWLNGEPELAIFFAALAGALLLPSFLIYWVLRRQFGRQFRAGTVLRSGFGEESFVFANPDATSTIRYTFLRKPRVRGQFLVVRQLPGRQDVYYPLALFPESARARIPG